MSEWFDEEITKKFQIRDKLYKQFQLTKPC